MSRVVVDEIKIIGSRCGPFGPVIKMLSNNLVKTEELIDATYAPEDGVKVFSYAAKSGVTKILFRDLE